MNYCLIIIVLKHCIHKKNFFFHIIILFCIIIMHLNIGGYHSKATVSWLYNTHSALLFSLTLLKMSQVPRYGIFPVILTSSFSLTQALTSNNIFVWWTPSHVSTSSALLSVSIMLDSRLWGGALLNTMGIVIGLLFLKGNLYSSLGPDNRGVKDGTPVNIDIASNIKL